MENRISFYWKKGVVISNVLYPEKIFSLQVIRITEHIWNNQTLLELYLPTFISTLYFSAELNTMP